MVCRPQILLWCLVVPIAVAAEGVDAGTDWPVYLGDRGATHYSGLKQINRENVDRLVEVWRWDGSENREDGRSQIQCNPLVIDGILYGTTADLHVVALDASNGTLIWRFDPFAGAGNPSSLGVNRGLSYWVSDDGKDRRLLFGAHFFIHALDPATGLLVEEFGEGGRVDLRRGLGRPADDLFVISNTPGAIFGDLIIMPVRVGEGPGSVPPGPIRAFDVRTGAEVWRFNTIPQPGEPGYETWPPDAWQSIGAANVWAGMTVDADRGLVFCPTGSAAFDFWGGDRLGDNLYANCLIALDAATGERVWHYQFVRHDLWDRDLPAPPSLVTIRRDGREIPAVAQITKSGHVFVFHRETGEPLFPIEEILVPGSDLAGEVASSTQPLPVIPAPFARQVFSAAEITDISPESTRAVLERFVTLRPHVPFLPPSREGTIIFPGFDGGGEWGGAAVDPSGVLYVNANEMPWVLTMLEVAKGETAGARLFLGYCAGCHGADLNGSPAQNIPELATLRARMSVDEVKTRMMEGKGLMPSFAFVPESDRDEIVQYLLGVADRSTAGRAAEESREANASPYTHTGYRRWKDPSGYPAVRPPWGTLNAIDLNTGEYRWKVPLGEYAELTARGVPKTGTENYGGPVVTAGGLLFIAATLDEKIRAFDTSTGEEIWKSILPAGGYATPATYEINGRQFLVIACGGGKMGTKSGDSYVAFALPEEDSTSREKRAGN